MNYVECFRAIARHRTNEIVITSAGNSGQAWWAATRDSVAIPGSVQTPWARSGA